MGRYCCHFLAAESAEAIVTFDIQYNMLTKILEKPIMSKKIDQGSHYPAIITEDMRTIINQWVSKWSVKACHRDEVGGSHRDQLGTACLHYLVGLVMVTSVNCLINLQQLPWAAARARHRSWARAATGIEIFISTVLAFDITIRALDGLGGYWLLPVLAPVHASSLHL